MDCEDTLELSATRRDGEPFIPGNYRVTTSLPNGKELLQTCNLNEKDNLQCQGDARLTVEMKTPQLIIRLSAAPTTITIQIRYEENTLGTETVSPDYYIVNPSDPNCDTVCFQASQSIEVAAPI
jgi:hypothetical protein